MSRKPCGVCKGTQFYNVPPKPCFQCDDGTVPVAWKDPDNPPIDLIRSLAREVGYAVGVHGSQLNDFDIMAFPWTEEAVSCDELVSHLCKNLVANDSPALMLGSDDKPFGRRAFTIQMNGYYRPIDLSVAPNI
jgi:hypothetical protein